MPTVLGECHADLAIGTGVPTYEATTGSDRKQEQAQAPGYGQASTARYNGLVGTFQTKVLPTDTERGVLDARKRYPRGNCHGVAVDGCRGFGGSLGRWRRMAHARARDPPKPRQPSTATP